jgi:2-keto-4-pentenoate hydratase/2-oxohepta-3-ene-1,7-dioic acid hydratase in catechol pathway
MKLLRHGPRGAEKPGLLDSEGHIRDLSAQVADISGAQLLPAALESLSRIDPASLPHVPTSARIGPCVGAIGKLVCVGLNYTDHAAEANMAIPSEPVLFLKPTSCIVGPNDDVEIPLGATKTDWEVELGIVIGKPAKYVTTQQAMDHVAGYCVVNDVSERAFQLDRGGTWDKGKGCDTFAPIGPYMVTRDEIPDPQSLALWLEVDGKSCQQGSTSKMIFGVAHLVSYISQFMSLRSGDVITTGTPPGVGMGQRPPRYLSVGQIMRLGITGLGVQQQRTIEARREIT